MGRAKPELRFLGSAKSRILYRLVSGDRTAAQVASDLGVQVSAARKHLERLREKGVVDRRFVRQRVGRPKVVYSITPEGRELFPRTYDVILNRVLARLVEDEGRDHVEALLRREAEELGRTMDAPGAPKRERLDRLIDGLNELGFDAILDRRDGACVITSRNCPLLKAAKVHRELVCRGLHAEIIRSATGAASVTRGKWIADGDPVCTHRFPTASGSATDR